MHYIDQMEKAERNQCPDSVGKYVFRGVAEATLLSGKQKSLKQKAKSRKLVRAAERFVRRGSLAGLQGINCFGNS